MEFEADIKQLIQDEAWESLSAFLDKRHQKIQSYLESSLAAEEKKHLIETLLLENDQSLEQVIIAKKEVEQRLLGLKRNKVASKQYQSLDAI